MKCYLIWVIDLPTGVNTTDRDMYCERFPNASQYLPFYLFPATIAEITNLSCEVVNLTAYTLVDVEEEKQLPTDLTKAEFLNICDSMIEEEYTGKCVVLSVTQGKFLHKERYATVDDV